MRLRRFLTGTPYRGIAFRLEEGIRGRKRSTLAVKEHAEAAINWILHAQAACSTGGIPASYDVLTKRWAPPYPETTGYIICSILRAAGNGLGDPRRLRDSASSMGRWLLSTQMANGAFPAGHIGLANPKPAVFNTGQVLQGLIALAQDGLDEDGRFAKSADRAARWMIEQQDSDGAWRRGVSQLTTEPIHTYYVRAAWPLAQYGKTRAVKEAVQAGLRNAEWVVSSQDKDDWFPHMNFNTGENPFTHTVAYTLQGLVEIGVLCGRNDLIGAALRAAQRMRQVQDPATGALPGQLDRPYRSAADWTDTSANSQMAVLWFRLGDITGDPSWREAALSANVCNCSLQDIGHRNPVRRGGLPSSYPRHLGYQRFKYVNWGLKFFLDALMDQMGCPTRAGNL